MVTMVFMNAKQPALSGKEMGLYILLLAFMVTLYIPQTAINSICIGLLFVYSLFMNPFSEKWELFKKRRAVQLMLLFFLLHVISTLFSSNKAEALDLLGRRMALLLFPFSIGLIMISDVLRKRIMLSFAVITTIAAVYCLALASHHYTLSGFNGHLYSNDLSQYVDKQSIYFATMVNIAMLCYAHALLHGRYPAIVRVLMYTAILLLSAVLFLLASRMAMLAFGVCAFILVGYIMVKHRKWLAGISIILVFTAEFFLLSDAFPKATNRFEELQYTQYNFASNGHESNYNSDVTPDQWNGVNIRLAVWNCGWQLAKQHFIAGSNLGDKMDNLLQVYKYNHFNFGYESRRNLHNTYLDVLVTFGISGLAIFLLGYLVMPLINNIKTNDLFSCFVLLLIGWQLVTESYLDRSIGCILLCFFVSVAEGWKKERISFEPLFNQPAVATTYMPG